MKLLSTFTNVGGIFEAFLLAALTAYTNGFSSILNMYGTTLVYISPLIILGLFFGALKKREPDPSNPTAKVPNRATSALIWGIMGALIGWFLVGLPVEWVREDKLFRVFTGAGFLNVRLGVFVVTILLPIIIMAAFRKAIVTFLMIGFMIVSTFGATMYFIPMYRDNKQIEVFSKLLKAVRDCKTTIAECTEPFEVQQGIPITNYVENQLVPPPGGWVTFLTGMIAVGRAQQAQTVLQGFQDFKNLMPKQ